MEVKQIMAAKPQVDVRDAAEAARRYAVATGRIPIKLGEKMVLMGVSLQVVNFNRRQLVMKILDDPLTDEQMMQIKAGQRPPQELQVGALVDVKEGAMRVVSRGSDFLTLEKMPGTDLIKQDQFVQEVIRRMR